MVRRFIRSERSQSLVEFSVALPLLLIVVLAIVDFGVAFGSYVELRNAAREGARFAMVGNPAGAFPADCTGSFGESVVGRVCSTAGDLDLDDIQDVDVEYPEGQLPGNSVVVRAEYRYELVTPLSDVITLISGGSFPGFFDLTATSDMRLE